MNRRNFIYAAVGFGFSAFTGYFLGRYSGGNDKALTSRTIYENGKGLWFVGTHGGAYKTGVDISEAFNKTASAKGDKPGTIIFPKVDGVLYVDAQTLAIPPNSIVDLNGNHLKLADHASKYIMMNTLSHNSGGDIVVMNGTIDGNKQGEQKRQYQSFYDDESGRIYPFEENYTGFGLVFNKVENLVVKNLIMLNQEGWGIAHFCCDHASFENLTFKGSKGTGRNGDGVTGVATLHTNIKNISGYTNDDMCAISTSRATVDGMAVFNPKHGRSIGSFIVDGLTAEKNDTECCYIGAGVYTSDGYEISDVSLQNWSGDFAFNVLRVGNFWAAGVYNASNGLIQKLQLNNISSNSNSVGISIFEQKIKQFVLQNVQLGKVKGGIFEDASPEFIKGMDISSPLVQVLDGASIQRLDIVKFSYLKNDGVSPVVNTPVEVFPVGRVDGIFIDGHEASSLMDVNKSI